MLPGEHIYPGSLHPFECIPSVHVNVTHVDSLEACLTLTHPWLLARVDDPQMKQIFTKHPNLVISNVIAFHKHLFSLPLGPHLTLQQGSPIIFQDNFIRVYAPGIIISQCYRALQHRVGTRYFKAAEVFENMWN